MRKHWMAIAGAVLSAVLAGLLALVINVGLLRAADTASGPRGLRATLGDGGPLPTAVAVSGAAAFPEEIRHPRPAGSSHQPAPTHAEREFGSNADD